MHEERNIKYPDGKTLETVRQEFEQALNDLRLSGETRDQRLAQLEQDMISMQSAIAAKQSYGVGGGSGGGNGTSLLDKSDLTYQGSFVPTGSYSGITADFRGSGIGFNSANNSLFMSGKYNYDWAVMEFEIPETLGDATVDTVPNLPTATHLQSRSFTSSDIPSYGIDSDASPTAWFVSGTKLYGSISEFYDANANANASMMVWDSKTLSGANLTGLYRIGSLIGGYTSGFTYEIPAAKQSMFGNKTHACGKGGGPIVSASGNGPAFIAFDVADVTGSTATPISAVNAMYYPWEHPLGGQSEAIFNGVSHVTGGAILTGTNCVVFFGDGATPGSKGYVNVGYGSAESFNDSNRGGQGFHSEDGDYGFFLWWYDLDDIQNGYDGSVAPYSITPYHWEYITLPRNLGGCESGGLAYDPTGKRLFFCEVKAGVTGEYFAYPLIHVYTHP